MVMFTDPEEAINFICKNKKNVSHIQEYLVELESSKEEKEILALIPILTGVFSFYTKINTWICVNDNEMEIDAFLDVGSSSAASVDDMNAASKDGKKMKEIAERKINLWLYNAYKSYWKLLLSLLSHKQGSVQLKSLEALFEIIEAEYATNMINANNRGSTKHNFPNFIYIRIIKQILITDSLSHKLVNHLKTLFSEYDDLCYYCLKDIHSLLNNQRLVQKFPFATECIPRNTFEILMLITNRNSDVANEICLYVDLENVVADATEIQKGYKHVFSSAWLALLHLPKHPIVILKKVLINLDTKIIPKMANPKLLIDFLTDSYDAGGICSLLALNGLFTLINKFNLDYPEFYIKLYGILEVNIFYTKYKSRMFYLLDLFLTSTYLPAYLVMAFVKKLARIALFTPTEDLYMLLKFIKNLMIRHPSSRILIHRQNENAIVKSVSTDPFNYEEDDPYKSNASKSCLWELESLKSYYLKDVLKLLLSFRKEFPLVEDDISEYFDKDFENMTASYLDEDITDEKLPPLNFEKRMEIYSFDSKMWCM